jgi:uncharacterized protein (DUF2461 family)
LKENIPPFGGFSKDSFKFLSDLAKNNNVDWFNKNKSRYNASLVLPARSFIVEISQFFNRLNPSIRTEPKFNETIMRINKDMRFTKGEPYRNYFLLHFGRFKMDTEFYVYFEERNFQYGIFINNSEDNDNFYFGRNIIKYRNGLLKLAETSGINECFELYDMKKEITLVEKQFCANRHLDKLSDMKMILLQKSLSYNQQIIYSPDFIIEAVKTFSILYPLYCFSVSPQPLKMIEKFEEQFGILQ